MNYYKKVSDKEIERLVNKFISIAYNIWRKKQMKQFDYWWEENATEYDVENYHKNCMRRSWKAALEWVDKKCDQLDDDCCLDCGCFSIVQNKIDEELEE